MDLTTIAGEVLAFIASERVELTDDIHQAEAVIRDQVLRIGAAALERHLSGRRLGYEGSGRPCPSCGGVQRFVSHRPRTLATLLGQVTIRRAYYHCPPRLGGCGASAVPYDARVGLGRCYETAGLAERAVSLAADEPHRRAAAKLAETTGQRLCASTVRALAVRVGSEAAREEGRQAGRMATWDAPSPEDPADLPAVVYAAADGTMGHRLDGWHEMKAACVYWDDAGGRRHARYVARWERAPQFVPFVWALAGRWGWERAGVRALQGDGAAWVWDDVGAVLGTDDHGEVVHGVDWWHALQQVWAAGRALHGDGPAAGEWVKPREALLWDGKWRDLRDDVRREYAHCRSPPRREALASLATYLSNQGEAGRLDYARFREMGLNVGDGPVESACKHVVGLRLKRGGMRWSEEGSQAVVSLRCARLNGDWKGLWDRKPLLN
jgi:hypothetical protein